MARSVKPPVMCRHGETLDLFIVCFMIYLSQIIVQSVESFSTIGCLHRGIKAFPRRSIFPIPLGIFHKDDHNWVLLSTSTAESDAEKESNQRLHLALEKYFDVERISRPNLFSKDNNSSKFMYKISEIYNGNLPYWYDNLRVERFEDSDTKGLLYRPKMVNELSQIINTSLNSTRAKGVYVTGPQNIGKSFSLVNLVIQLEASGEYLVTFIPDCERWETTFDLVDVIFKSFRSNAKDFGHSQESIGKFKDKTTKIIDDIASILAEMGKKWIFVFDQINCIFVECNPNKATKVGRLPFPYNLMKSVMKPKRIISIISASANNEASYKDKHEGFIEYIHQNQMDRQEVEAAFFNAPNTTDKGVKTLSDKTIDLAMDISAGVPGYVDMFVSSCNGNVETFEFKIKEQVVASHSNLNKAVTIKEWDGIKDSIITSILGITTRNGLDYDRQYFVRETVGGLNQYHALIPTITSACRSLLFQDLIMYVSENEAELLAICQYTDDDSIRVSFFEYIVISRILSREISFNLTTEKKIIMSPTYSDFFEKKTFPEPLVLVRDGAYVPLSNNYPAINLILRQGNIIIGIQIHVGAKKRDDIERFAKLSEAAHWLTSFNETYLMYLSPTKNTTAIMKQLISINHPSEFSIIALYIKNIQGLDDLPWPA
jgi:hypothetical protein